MPQTTHQKILDRQITEKEDFIERFKKTPIIQVVCRQVGIGRSTFYRWIKDDPVFYQKYLEAEAEGREFLGEAMESHLIQLAQGGNLGAIIYYLKHNHPRYSESLKAVQEGDIKVIAEYVEHSDGSVNDYKFLSELFKRRIPISTGRFILQTIRRLSEVKKAENESRKIGILSRLFGKK